ncbi:MAG: pectinesterase family protein [Candidatus Ornithomonoglobus sp.]
MKTKKLTAWISAAALAAMMITPITVSHAAAQTLTVGAGEDYATICEAVAAAKTINPQSEADRVTINVNPGDYEEQVVFDNMKYITLQQTPGTEGKVNLHWYYCTGYAASNVDLTGAYNPNIDWTADATWTGPQGTDNLTKYTLGQAIAAGTTIEYYDKSGTKQSVTVKNAMYLGDTGGLDKMAALIVRNNSADITVKDFNIVNSVPVMVTQGQKDAHLTPCANYPNLPDRSSSALANCTEDTTEVRPTADIYDTNNRVDITKYRAAVESGITFNAGESVWLARSGTFNERGHAVSVYSGDRITFEDIRLRGGQDSLFASGGRVYFKNCDLIGGTDYIYGSATAVFDTCKLGFEGFSDRVYGSPLATPSTVASRKYGYLFYNCTIYNVRDNAGTSNFGGPWGAAGQATFFNTTLDDNASIGKSALVIDPKGWCRFGAENGLGRLYEYGTKNASGAAVDLSQRVVNLSKEEGGYGMGTVLDEWQILEFNPRNYFAAGCGGWSSDWDPMGFGAEYLTTVDDEIAAAEISVPEGEETQITLPAPKNDNIEFQWVSSSSNAVVSEDGKSITVIRPAAGEAVIESSVILYARDKTTGFGDVKEIPVSIEATTNTADVFNIPITIEQSMSTANTYKVTISKNGALIKSQNIEVSGNTAEAVIENIPANAEGIDYDVTIISASNDFTVTVPEDGKTTVKGITGKDVAITVISQKLADKTIAIDKTTSASDGNQTYDIIALAKEAGASDNIASSDIISVEFDVDVDSAMTTHSYIDFSSGTPSNKSSAVPERFSLIRMHYSWHQLDAVDNSQGFSGTSSNEHQALNFTGKFEKIYPAENHVKITIDYKESTVTIDGEDNGGTYKTATPYTFASFPENAEKGNLNMGIFVGSTNDSYTIKNITVGYKDIVTEEEDPGEEPITDILYDFRASDNKYINATNSSKDDPRGSIDGNAYDLNGDGTVVFSKDCYQSQTTHGVVVWGGDKKIVIKVGGPTAITVGGCQFAAATTVTLKKTDGTTIASKAYAKECWTGTATDTNTVTLKYTDDAAAELMVCFDSYTYLPMLEIKDIVKTDYEGETVTLAEKYEDPEKGDFAYTYKTSIDYSEVKAPQLKWVVELWADNNGTRTLGTAEVNIDTTISGNSYVQFGLILTGTEAELEDVESVRLELQ